MCGIWAWIHNYRDAPNHDELWEKGVKTLEARGPEGSRWLDVSGATWCFTRLAINGLNEGAMQPFQWGSRWAWMCNGEIYNSAALEKATSYISSTGSDCEVLGALYETCERDAVAFARALDGVFAIVLYYEGKFVVARDPYGVRPLYYMNTKDRGIMFASERKALEPFAGWDGDRICEFPPGEVWEIVGPIMKKEVYHSVPWVKGRRSVFDLTVELEAAVEKRLMTERPVAALLSGGVDSSLIAALVQKRLKELGKPPLKTFSIAMEGGTDLQYARLVADWIGSEHHEVIVSADEMFDAIPAVIRDIESYDITTVRASVGNWLIAKTIRATTDCKVVFNGDGSDEIFGSYMYFYRAPSNFAFERETQRLLKEIHQYDVLRSDRSISSHGLEARTPFLDKQFVACAMSYPTELRRPGGGRMEKQLLRDAFYSSGILPEPVLFRKKEAFSDGVSSQEKSWFEIIQEKVAGLVPEGWREDALARHLWPLPTTAEAYYYRMIFDSMYTHTGQLWPFWMPRWSPETSDPSARTLIKIDAGRGGTEYPSL
jgi:asparagine synthase (glutamine-hydrolysing)